MQLIIYIVLIVTIVEASDHNEISESKHQIVKRIVGGTTVAQRSDFPYQVCSTFDSISNIIYFRY